MTASSISDQQIDSSSHGGVIVVLTPLASILLSIATFYSDENCDHPRDLLVP